MTNPNWGILQMNGPMGGFQNALAQGWQMGTAVRQQREETERRNALADYATNPSDETFGAMAQAAPEYAIQERQRQEQREAAARQQQQEQMGTVRQLLQAAGENPMQAYQAAQSMGIDLSGVPQPGSPGFEQWRQQQLFIMDALETPQGQEIMSTAGKQAFDEGFRPGTQEFQARVTEIVNAGLTSIVSYQPGGGVAAYNRRDGSSVPVVQPGGAQAVPPLPPGFQLEEGTAGNGGGGFPGH